jgi:ACS family hexuronate transporter-like MFS transporter
MSNVSSLSQTETVSSVVGKYRWTIVALLFAATTINYIDRNVISYLKQTLSEDFHWNNEDYGNIMGLFQFFYAFGLLMFGWIVDRVGTKMGYVISIIIWSLSAMAHALAGSTVGFTIARSSLGLGESGNFPAAIKAVAEWFPKRERALATGIFNSGANIGAVVAPIMVPLILAAYGWQMAFIITGALGFIWLIFWWFIYDIPSRKKHVSPTEYAYIHSDDESKSIVSAKVPWGRLLKVRQTWAFVFGKFFTDPIWWFFLFWLPDYFHKAYSQDVTKVGWPLVIIYSCTTIGSIGGGYLSGMLIKRGWEVYRARKVCMFIFACCVIPIVSARYFQNMWVVVALISLAAASHQAWSANIFTTVGDMFPRRAVSSVTGIGGMAGSIGGIIFQPMVGWILDYFARRNSVTTGYNFIFTICGSAYIVAWVVMHFFAPKMTRVQME